MLLIHRYDRPPEETRFGNFAVTRERLMCIRFTEDDDDDDDDVSRLFEEGPVFRKFPVSDRYSFRIRLNE